MRRQALAIVRSRNCARPPPSRRARLPRRKPRSARRPRIWRGRAPSAAASMPKQAELEQRIALLDAPIRRHRRGAGQARSCERKRRQSPGLNAELARLVRPGRGAGSRAYRRRSPPKMSAQARRSRMPCRRRERQASGAGATDRARHASEAAQADGEGRVGRRSSMRSASAAATSRRSARRSATISTRLPTRPRRRIGG